ncbi:haloacid dehalogenase-like hydrolase domain-containing protein 2 [Paramacrobiotus metropolitanus]|uniref:haloacid dehalogenase-like hydrolase domain-containing protein 2 n=1 Tax=Paramacrobiotus metropolitanus TaxID=2943436 RepID=UPI002445BB1E|nr:haloacid dehalogenase-like hydrolase domain-containing protein 2 [Paramacrobiotus metropolitanus]
MPTNTDLKPLLPTFRVLHRHAKMTRFCMALFDLSGTLHVDDHAIPGAVQAIDRLRQTGMPLRFVTNTTKESKRMLHQRLTAMGFHINPDEIFTSITAARKILEAKKWRPWLLVSDEAMEDFEGLPTNDPDAVVIGLAPEKLNYENMNKAFNMVLNDGAHLVAIHKSRYYQTKHGSALGPGAFVTGLEYATDTKAQVVGKPDAAFFLSAIPGVLSTHKLNEIVMIGDDVRDDVCGAMKAGLSAILVKTGKYREGDENKIEPHPTFIASDVVQAVQYILEEL